MREAVSKAVRRGFAKRRGRLPGEELHASVDGECATIAFRHNPVPALSFYIGRYHGQNRGA